MLLTLANIITLNKEILSYAKEIDESEKYQCPVITMILYGDHESLAYDVTYEIGPASERSMRFSEPMSFTEIKNAVCKLGEIHRVELITSTNKSLAFVSHGYRITNNSTDEECQYAPHSTFADNVRNTLYALFLN